MEDHKVAGPDRVAVRNRYTVFLCPEDYERLRNSKDKLIPKFERHLTKHVKAKKYELPGEIKVDMVVDTDLKLGHFGILAERAAPGLSEELVPFPRERSTAMVERPRPSTPALVPQTPSPTPRAKAPRVKSVHPAPANIPSEVLGGATAVISPGEAGQLDLAWQTLVLKAGNREREFTKSRVIVGRAKDADFRIDDPNVSRRHAAIFWSDGSVMIEDLGSTNGTMVNGYPVSSTALRPGDIVVIGDCRITVETR